jgi:hypothetical protein
VFLFLASFFLSLNPSGGVRGPVNISLAGTITSDSTYVIPFSRAGNLIVVQATADSTTGNFIIDTGCPGLVLNLTYFRNYRLLESDQERNDINGARFMVSQTEVASFSFAGKTYPRVVGELANLGNIENLKGIRLLGLIGFEFFRNSEVIFDFEKSEIRMRHATKKRSASYSQVDESTADFEMPITVSDNRIILNTTMSGKKIKLIIDSGAERNLLDSRLPDRIFENVNITGRTLLSGAGSSKVEVMTGDLKVLNLGGHSVENVPVMIANLERTCFAYDGCVDGVVGFDVLSVKRLGFNFVNSKMYIWK